MACRRYSIYVKPEGERKWRYTGKTFKKKINAQTYANLEEVAGVGESYSVRHSKRKGWYGNRRGHAKAARKGKRRR